MPPLHPLHQDSGRVEGQVMPALNYRELASRVERVLVTGIPIRFARKTIMGAGIITLNLLIIL